MNLFEENILLLTGSAFIRVVHSDTFIFLEGNAFLSEYIAPVVGIDDFDYEQTETIVEEETEKGKSISYYVPEMLVDDYKDLFRKSGYENSFIDLYLYKELASMYEEDESYKLEEVTDNNFQDYINAAKSSFPEWGNEEEYTKYFFELSKQEHNSKLFKNFVLRYEGDIVSFGSVILDKDLNLAYLHNSGILEEYRRMGYFSIMIKLIMNYCLENNITRVYTIVTKDEGSDQAYHKMGFIERDKFYNYS